MRGVKQYMKRILFCNFLNPVGEISTPLDVIAGSIGDPANHVGNRIDSRLRGNDSSFIPDNQDVPLDIKEPTQKALDVPLDKK